MSQSERLPRTVVGMLAPSCQRTGQPTTAASGPALVSVAGMTQISDLFLSSWITEAARAAVLSGRGHGDASVRSQARARLIASACADQGVRIVPRFASAHAEWMADVAGSQKETGALGWFFLQRLGMFVDAHLSFGISAPRHQELVSLGAPDVEEVNRALAETGLPPTPGPEWPHVEESHPEGKVVTKIGIIGDPHIGLASSNELVPAVISALGDEGIGAAVAMGDMTQDGREEYFIKAKEVFAAAKFPVLMTLGNHDMWGRGSDIARGQDWFATHLGGKPFGATKVGPVTLVVLNSADPVASTFPPFDMMLGTFTEGPKESVTRGEFGEEVTQFMAEVDVEPPAIIFLHHPPYPYMALPPIVFGLTEQSTDLLTTFAHRIGAAAIFCGHTHRSARYEVDSVPVIEVPSAKEWPFGYGVIEVSDTEFSYNLKPIPDKALIEKASMQAGVMFRRYGRGPDSARSFTLPL